MLNSGDSKKSLAKKLEVHYKVLDPAIPNIELYACNKNF